MQAKKEEEFMDCHRAVEHRVTRARVITLHIVKFLTRLPSICTLSFVGVIVGWTGADVRLVDSVVRGRFVSHSIVPDEHQKRIHFKLRPEKNSNQESALKHF